MTLDEYLPQLGELDGPVIVHHATGDETTPFENSKRLAAGLETVGVTHSIHGYESDQHLFGEPDRSTAADRDAEFFHSH